jgi:hypothetical protein
MEANNMSELILIKVKGCACSWFGAFTSLKWWLWASGYVYDWFNNLVGHFEIVVVYEGRKKIITRWYYSLPWGKIDNFKGTY